MDSGDWLETKETLNFRQANSIHQQHAQSEPDAVNDRDAEEMSQFSDQLMVRYYSDEHDNDSLMNQPLETGAPDEPSEQNPLEHEEPLEIEQPLKNEELMAIPSPMMQDLPVFHEVRSGSMK